MLEGDEMDESMSLGYSLEANNGNQFRNFLFQQINKVNTLQKVRDIIGNH